MYYRSITSYCKRLVILPVLLAAVAVSTPLNAAANNNVSQLLASGNASGVPLKAQLSAYYNRNGNSLIWFSRGGLTPQAERAIEAIANAEDEGLSPKDYNIGAIQNLRNASDIANQAKLDVLLSNAILRFANDIRYGRNSAERRETYGTQGIQAVSTDILTRISKATPNDVSAKLAEVAPPMPEYAALRKELQRYRTIKANGGLPQLTFYRMLQLHNNVPAVKTLREILVATGDLAQNNGSEMFDEELDQALRQFQQRHGIEPDGVAGRETRQELNTPAETRIRAITASMERLRWSPVDLGKKYVIVNLPGYSLRAVRPGAEDLTMKIIVGKAARQSPTFVRSISQVIFNPPWTVPPRIAAEDILPDIKKYTEFFQTNDFKLLRYNAGGGTSEVNPKTINWDNVNQSNFAWTLYQPPGDRNPLGRVKFFIPNTPSVYMHDTPRKNLFSDGDRNLSSGCIRLELPKSFADYVLAGESGWSTERVYKTFNTTSNTQYVPVRNQPRLYFVYWTATVDKKGLIYFHDDIYGRDKALLKGFGQA